MVRALIIFWQRWCIFESVTTDERMMANYLKPSLSQIPGFALGCSGQFSRCQILQPSAVAVIDKNLVRARGAWVDFFCNFAI